MPEGLTASFISLGGNVGDVASAMQRALDAIQNHPDCRVVALSRVYKTPPWGGVTQDWFLNAAAKIETSLAPEAFLDFLLEIERSEGRVRDQRWGPRTLDLDIIAHGDIEMRNDKLSLPHPRMAERAFVLVPMMDIAADLKINGRTIRDYAAEIDTSEIELADASLVTLSS